MIGKTFFSTRWAAQTAGLAMATTLFLPLAAQQPAATPDPAPAAAAPAQQQDAAQASATISNTPAKKKPKIAKIDRVVASKDTRKENKKDARLNPLAGKDASLPDKALYDKALEQTKKGHFDVARLDLQTLLNTYPDSQYLMRAKLAIADSWFREGGTAALTQAEQEYTDFITFFPNVPEAAEAQMRVGDIYFKQMDVPDRDYQKAMKAEEAYRLMLKQYPESTLIKDATQKLREVQEVLASREAELGDFYATHENWPASIARYQTVADTYPLYSHMDDVLIAIGDGYAAEAKHIRDQPRMPEGPRGKLLALYDGKAAEAYRKVVLEHSAAEHVEDAKERLVAMNLPVPTPTPEQAAASEALEGSRAQYTFQKRMLVLLTRRPDTVTTAHTGDVPLDDPPPVVAPDITGALVADYKAAFTGIAPEPAHKSIDTPAPDAAAPAPTPVSNAPLTLNDVAAPGQGGTSSDTTTMTAAPPAAEGTHGSSVGVEVLTPGVTSTPSAVPNGTAADPAHGIAPVGPANTSALPPIDKPAAAPDQVNEAAGQSSPPTPAATPGKKTPKPAVDKEDESSSKKKPKKGLDKINPF
jgi:outer membrane protein assembly factor BamD